MDSAGHRSSLQYQPGSHTHGIFLYPFVEPLCQGRAGNDSLSLVSHDQFIFALPELSQKHLRIYNIEVDTLGEKIENSECALGVQHCTLVQCLHRVLSPNQNLNRWLQSSPLGTWQKEPYRHDFAQGHPGGGESRKQVSIALLPPYLHCFKAN